MSRVLDRFLRYVTYDTQSDPASTNSPSTAKQLVLLDVLVQELHALGIADAVRDDHGVVTATIPATTRKASVPAIGFVAHVDTSPEVSGAGVKPVVHRNWRGGDIVLACAGNALEEALGAWEILASQGRIVELFAIPAWGDVGESALVEMARFGRLVCVENGNVRSGLGTWLQARFNDLGLLVRVRKVGPSGGHPALVLPDRAAIARAVDEEILRRATLGRRIDPEITGVF
jgi:hypothetical protein